MAASLAPTKKNGLQRSDASKEVTVHPDKMISVHVEDVTDENGAPIVTVQYIGDPEDRRRRPDRPGCGPSTAPDAGAVHGSERRSTPSR